MKRWDAKFCGLVATLLASSILLAQTPQQKAWSILEEGAKEKGPDKRSKAVRALGLVPHDPEAVSIAEKALEDERPEVRTAAATALGLMPSPASTAKLKNTLSDKEIAVVLAAAHSLLLLHDNACYEVYYAILMRQRKSTEGLLAEGEETLRNPKKMAGMGFEEAIGYVPYGGFAYSAFKELRKDDVSPVRAAAAKALANDPDPRSARALTQAASDKSWTVRAAALDAIAERGDPGLLKDIVPAMSDERDLVRYTAAAAVIRLSAIQKSAAGSKKQEGGSKQ
jgi:HEAT repeat protein